MIDILNNSGLGFNGLSFTSSGGYVPPDTCGAAGPLDYLETVNQSVALFPDKSTGANGITDSLSHFLFTTGGLSRADSGSGLSDPIVCYDEKIGRYILGDQDVNFSTHVSAFDLAVSKSSDPNSLSASDWNFYKITTTQTGFDADYPGNFGYNADAFVFSLNMFGVTSGGHTQIVSVNAADLANGVANPALYRNNLNDFSLRPTTMHDSLPGDPMWLTTEHGDNASIDIIRMSNVLTNAATFSYTNIPVTPYSGAVAPRNPNGTIITDNIDSRIDKGAESGGILVAAHCVGASSTQDVIQWYAVNVGVSKPILQQQGRISAGPNTYLTYPGCDINPKGDIGLSYLRSGTDTSSDFLSMMVTGRLAGDAPGTLQTPLAVPSAQGKANYRDFTSTSTGGGRSGDLSGINVDPVNGTFWAASEYANTQATANWGTGIVNFRPSAPTTQADLAISASGPASITAGGNATYLITVSNNGPSAASGFVLSDLLPTGASLVSMTQTGGADAFTLATTATGLTETASGTIASGSSDSFTLVVKASATAANGAAFVNTASMSSDSSTSDPSSANNSVTVTGSIVGGVTPGDVAISNVASATTANEGDTITYTLKVTNNDRSAAATGLMVTDTLDSKLAYVSASTPQGSFSVSGNVITFTLGSLAAGGSLNLTVRARASEEGSLGTTAVVSASSAESTQTNNSGVTATSVLEPAISVSAPIVVSRRSNSGITVATFSHASGVEPGSAFRATINWGDGTTSTGTISLSGSTYVVKGSHTYFSTRNYQVSTTVTELGQATELLMAKMGDEHPAPLDRHPVAGGNGLPHGLGRLDPITGQSLDHSGRLAVVPGASTTPAFRAWASLVAGRGGFSDPQSWSWLLWSWHRHLVSSGASHRTPGAAG